MGTDDNSGRPGRSLRDKGWKPRKNLFPPPKDAPEYANRPLPPRPLSSSSSIYDSDQGTPPLTQHHLFSNLQEDARLSTNFHGAIDESALKMVRPPSIITDLPASHDDEDENDDDDDDDRIASPQPRPPGHKVLKLRTQDDFDISPILTPRSSGNTHFHYTVSPLSPDGSVRSFDAVSEPDHSASYLRPSSSSNEKDAADTRGRSSSQADSTQGQTALGFQPLAIQTESLHPRLHRINLRYSDPGSPVKGTIDLKDFGEPGPDVGRSARLDQRLTAGGLGEPKQYHHDSWSFSPTAKDSVNNEERKVAFAGANIESFSHRTAGPSQRHAPAPLKLSERPLAESYVKTPFPPRLNSDYSQKSVFEDDDGDRKLNRRMSNHISGFAKSLRPASSHRADGSGSGFGPTEARKGDEPSSRASPVPMVKNILSKAKSGLKIGSEEARRERKRENLKRQIKVGTLEE